MPFMKALTIVPLALIALGACSKKKTTRVEKLADVSARHAVAMVDDEAITESEMELYGERFSPVQAAQYKSSEGRKKLLEQMLRFEIFAKEARDQGYDKDPEVMFAMKQQMTSRMVRDKVKVESSDIPDVAIEQYYTAHIAEFSQPEQVKLAEIVVGDKQRAGLVLSAARALPAGDAQGFRELVIKYSEDVPSKAMGGDVGSLEQVKQRQPSPVSEAASKLTTVGQVSALVPTIKGFAILRLTEKTPDRTHSLPEVRDEIRQRLLAELRAKRMDDWSTAVRAKHKVKIVEDQIN